MKKIRKAVNKVKTFIVDHSVEIFVAGTTLIGAGSVFLLGVLAGESKRDEYYLPRLKDEFNHGKDVGAYCASAAFIADHERAEKWTLDGTRILNDDFEEIYGDAKREKIVADGLDVLKQIEKA